MRPAFGLALVVLALPHTLQGDEPAAPPKLEAFRFDELAAEMATAGQGWRTFLDRPSLYAGVYRLEAGAADGQSPHAEDEVYWVVRGRAVLEVDGERTEARAGAILFVAAGAEHRFVEIDEDLELLVFFSRGPGVRPAAPADGAAGRSTAGG